MPPEKKHIRRHSTLDVDFAMDKLSPPEAGANFNVVIIGAGGINLEALKVAHGIIRFVLNIKSPN